MSTQPTTQPTTPRTAAPAPTSVCCGLAVPTVHATITEPAAASFSACCGDPTPNAETGACCSAPAPTCGCQSKAAPSVDMVAAAVEPSGATPPVAEPSAEGRLPVAVIGAGPIGLAAAVQLVAKGETPLVLEAGDQVGASIREWAHVRLFSPWKYLVEPTMRAMLERQGWTMPDADALPTGGELLTGLVEPLATLPEIAPHLRLGHRVMAVTRRGYDKVKTAGRDEAPFELVVRTPDGRTERLLARAVIDASGTWRSPNPMGAGGVAAEGEPEAAAHTLYGIPDVFGRDRARYAGRRVLVVGSGHSAFNALLDLAALREEAPGTEIVWAIRRTDVGLMFGGGRKDALAARGALGERLRRLVDSGTVRLELGVRIARVSSSAAGVVVESDSGARIGPVDEIIVTTGFRPDLSLTRELRVRLDRWLEAPEQLAPLIDPNLHSCGTVCPHGAAELAHPERDYYVVGMKSYGRAPTFLLLTGYEQVRSVVCALVGDEEGARNVELVLPETGVCQTDLGGSSSFGGAEAGTAASCGTSASSCGAPDAREVETEAELELAGAGVADAGAAGAGACCR
ncbi:MAG TPA: NAD(P)-binding domain-containing protein [Gemmatimonadales bacterium]